MNSKYEIILYWSQPDQAFLAEVPELAGCMADGQTYQEALQQVEIIVLTFRPLNSYKCIRVYSEGTKGTGGIRKNCLCVVGSANKLR